MGEGRYDKNRSDVHFFLTDFIYLQGCSTKIKTSQVIDDVMQTRGAGGMPPPGKFLKFRVL